MRARQSPCVPRQVRPGSFVRSTVRARADGPWFRTANEHPAAEKQKNELGSDDDFEPGRNS
ncbi:MAG: hypothetical protein WA645_08380, partial [Pseudolabrys sp.]